MAEYDLLERARENSHEGSGRRFGYYSAALSLSIAGVSFASASIENLATRRIVAVAAGSFLVVLGLGMFVRLLELKSNANLYTRGLNALREYFSTIAPELQPYLVLPQSENETSLLSKRKWFLADSLAGTVGMTNGAIVGFLCGFLVGEAEESVVIGSLVGAPILGLTAFLHLRYQRHYLKKSEKHHEAQMLARRSPRAPS